MRGEPESSSTSHLIPQPLSHKSLKNQQGVEKLKLNTERGLELQLVCGPGENRETVISFVYYGNIVKNPGASL